MRNRWWGEWEVWAVLGIVTLAYLGPLLRLPVRGEEPRWSQTATEMLRAGDYLVPRQQGTLFLSRPPLHVWILAGLQSLTGTDRAWVIRLPSLLAVLLVCALLYAYVRSFASRFAAAAAGLIFATSGEMMQLGAIAESDASFVLFVAASLLFWHLSRLRGWHPAVGWSAAYVCLGLAALCKGGPQPPVYFLGPVVLYLVLTRDLRSLFHWGHLLGIVLAGGIVASWLVPFIGEVGVANARQLLGQDTAQRLVASWPVFLRHLARFPLEVAGSNLPWLPLAGFLLVPAVRERVGRMSRPLLFAGLALGVAFPTCWLPPGGETRYFAPLYPFLGVVVAIAIEAARRARVKWVVFSRAYAAAAAAVALAVLVMGFSGITPLADHPAIVVMLALGLFGIAALIALTPGVRHVVTAVAVAAALVCGVWLTGVRVRRSPDLAAAADAVRARIPTRNALVSFDLIPSVFAYHYGEPIRYVGLPTTRKDFERVGWFCLTVWGDTTPKLPGAWTEIARIPVERSVSRPTGRVVIVGRVNPSAARTSGPAVTAASGSCH
jgi:4-amino-4-deoxy-L-arabinose transferase-like glycosyltransferase